MQSKVCFGDQSSDIIDISDEAFMDRLITIPFCNAIPIESRDTFLIDKLIAEKDAIAIKALVFYRKLVDNNYKFTGDFQVNSSIYFQGGAIEADYIPTDITSEIQIFLLRNVEADPNVFTPTEELREAFQKKYHSISSQKFSALCEKICESVFSATKQKKHVKGYKSSIHVILGIKWKNQ